MFDTLELELHPTDWKAPKEARCRADREADREEEASRHLHHMANPPKSLAQRQQDAVRDSRLLQFLDAAKRGDLGSLQALRDKAGKFRTAGGVDLVVKGLFAEECPRQDLVPRLMRLCRSMRCALKVHKTALQLAAARGHVQVVEWLLGCKAQPSGGAVFDALTGYRFDAQKAEQVC